MFRLFSFIYCLISLHRLTGQTALFYAGTYNQRGSAGIYCFSFNMRTGAIAPAGITKNKNEPSFLAFSPDQKYLYAVQETDPGQVSAYKRNVRTGALELLNTRPAEGVHPCHIAVDPGGHCVLAGNYSGGSVALYRLQSDGSLSALTDKVQHEGKSVNTARQEKAHVHSVNIAPDGRNVFVADLGMDRIFSYHLDTANCRLTQGDPPFVATKPGSGPRHFTFHPNGRFAYTILELDATATAMRYENGILTPLQTISTLPASYTGPNSCAHLQVSPDGRFLYASNRGHNSIVIFAIDPLSGHLTTVGHTSVGGQTPRHFTLDPSGRFLLVANQNSDQIRVFRRNLQTGKLKSTRHSVQVSMPVCLLFAAPHRK